MRFFYQQWDGSEFPTQEHLSQFAGFLDYVMEYGDQAMEAVRHAVKDHGLLGDYVEQAVHGAGDAFRRLVGAVLDLGLDGAQSGLAQTRLIHNPPQRVAEARDRDAALGVRVGAGTPKTGHGSIAGKRRREPANTENLAHLATSLSDVVPRFASDP
jgi:hypothetical protein